MSWSRRSILIGLTLSGCGFRPVHGPDKAMRRGVFSFRCPQTPDGYRLLGALESRFGVPQDPTMTLDITNLSVYPATILDNGSQSTKLAQMIAQAGWALGVDGRIEGSGQSSARVAFNQRGDRLYSDASTAKARSDAIVSLSHRLFEEVAARL